MITGNRATPETFRQPLELQLDQMLAAGFHKELGIPAQSYRQSIQERIQTLENDLSPLGGQNGVSPALVEPRIHFLRQAELLGIKVDPSLIDDIALPSTADNEPHVVFTRRSTNGYTPRDILEWPPVGFEPSHPLAGLVDHKRILTQEGASIYPGPESTKVTVFGFRTDFTHSPCLDTFLGKPRLTSIPLDTNDDLLGMVFRFRSPKYDHKGTVRNYIPVDWSHFRPK